MLRYSFSSLLLFILLAGVGCAALVHATPVWKQVTFTLMIVFLLGMTLAAITLQRGARAVSIGTAVCGWIYVTMVFVPALNLRDDLLTERANGWLYNFIHPYDAPQPATMPVTWAAGENVLLTGANQGRVVLWDVTNGQSIQATVSWGSFSDIAHSCWALIVAGLGGLCAALLYSRRRAHLDQPVDAE